MSELAIYTEIVKADPELSYLALRHESDSNTFDVFNTHRNVVLGRVTKLNGIWYGTVGGVLEEKGQHFKDVLRAVLNIIHYG